MRNADASTDYLRAARASRRGEFHRAEPPAAGQDLLDDLTRRPPVGFHQNVLDTRPLQLLRERRCPPQVALLAGTGFPPASPGHESSRRNSAQRQARQYTFGDLVRIRTVGELRRQGVPLPVIRQALDRPQQLTDDPLRELTLIAIADEVYVCRSREEVERATDGQLAFTILDVGAMLRRLRGEIASLRPEGAALSETTPLAAG